MLYIHTLISIEVVMWCNKEAMRFSGVCFGVHLFYLELIMDGKAKTGVFIGHRDCFDITTADIIPKIEEAINMGIVTFLNGGQGHFDKLCAFAVYELKEKYPQIKQILVAPYPSLKVDYEFLFDKAILFAPDWYIDQIGYKKAIPKRNEYMIKSSSVAICHVTHPSSGSYKTMQKAKDFGLTILNI